jgi:EF-P beta-lysylation protein EpmB
VQENVDNDEFRMTKETLRRSVRHSTLVIRHYPSDFLPTSSNLKMTIVSTSQSVVRPCFPRPPATTWQAALREAIRDPAELCRLLDLPDEVADRARAASGDFPLFVPRGYLARIKPGDVADPLLRQVLPLAEERQDSAGFSTDPVGDLNASPEPGLLHKYEGRVLLVATGACPVHCRYCFRRHFPYGEVPKSAAAWQSALDRIAADTSIREVILSGGDPLTLTDDVLAELIARIAAIDRIERVRVHTRFPVMIPERVTEELLATLTETRLTPVVVIHANHPRELDQSVADALARLKRVGLTLLNQSVLLRGVNDSVEVLAQLSQRLVEIGVLPYYLHQLDRVAGAAHFEVPVEEGRRIVKELRRRLPGYLVPRYVQEVPGAASKVVLE